MRTFTSAFMLVFLFSLPMSLLAKAVYYATPFTGNQFCFLALFSMTVDAGPDAGICQGGSAQLQATGANSYQWTPAAGLSCTNCPNPLATPSVTTTYTVTGDNGETDAVTIFVFAPPAISSLTHNNPTDCNFNNGSIAIVASGTAGAVEYSINGGLSWQSSGNFTALGPGNYPVSVRNANGTCNTSGGSISLTAPAAPQILTVLSNSPTLCDMPNGFIVVSGAGGISPLQYSINGGQTWQNQNTFQLLGSGNYVVQVRNATGSCVVTWGAVTLSASPNEPDISETDAVGPSDCEVSDGEITITLSNNNPGDFEYSINGGASYQAANLFTGLAEGTYHISVRQSNGTCAVDGGFVTLTSKTRPEISGISTVHPQACGLNNGNITIIASGSVDTEYSINGGATWQASPVFNGLPAGNYTILVRNADGSCETSGGAVNLTGTGAPAITSVVLTNPTACGQNDGSISIEATGTGGLEYSINGGLSWAASGSFTGLGEGSYSVFVRYDDGSCDTPYQLNPVILDAPGNPPVIDDILINHPGSCGASDGSITIIASGSSPLIYSINGSANAQANNTFSGLPAGTYNITVMTSGSNCKTTATVTLTDPVPCTDTVFIIIPPDVLTDVCLDPAVFQLPGNITAAGFCDQGSAATVAATSINQGCVTLAPAAGFTGTSGNTICVIHCFDNNIAGCDTTYMQVTVGGVNCDDIFIQDTLAVPFLGDPTPVCIPIPPITANNYDLILNGSLMGQLQGCDFDSVVIYSYTFMVGGGFNGPYTLDSWEVNGIPFSGVFINVNDLVVLMNAFDPTGNWQLDTQTGIIYGGNLSNVYGNIQVTHVPTGSGSIMTTNFSILPNGFIVNLTSPDLHTLIAIDPIAGCADTLYINVSGQLPELEVIHLTTSVNVSTNPVCLSGAELPSGLISSIGYCQFAANGATPIVNDSCVIYIPNQNFAGTDTFCVVVCSGGFPQICDTTIFIVNVVPDVDTVYLTIPAGVAALDTCLSNNIITLPGSISSVSFCNLNPNEIAVSFNQNCLSFSPVNNFSGTTEVCVIHCSGSTCDTTILIITVEPAIVCDDIFAQNTVTITSVQDSAGFCIPVNTGDIVSYDVFIDGVLFTQSYVPCGPGIFTLYNYSTLPTGPYVLDSWTVNGTVFSGPFHDLAEMVDSMNFWDPTGNWILDVNATTIFGGDFNNNYGNIIITQVGGDTFTLIPSSVGPAAGSQIPITGFGTHTIEVVGPDGCADTVTVVLEQFFISTDTIYLTTQMNVDLPVQCANTNELPGSLLTFQLCSLPASGGINFANDTCFVYQPNTGFIGTDNFCFVLCDDSQPPVCDTFIYIINVTPPTALTDTIFINAPGVTPFDTCLTNAVLQLPGNIFFTQVCGSDPNAVAITLNANCVTIDLADTFAGTTTACVVHCDDSNPSICDTTILVITFTTVPCPVIFNPDNINVALENGAGEVCLPVPLSDIINYNIFIDGNPYGGSLSGCEVDSVYSYFYGVVPGQGNQGPYSVTWEANGGNFTATVNNIAELVDLMNNWDPAGDWVLEPSTFTISSSNDSGIYGNLVISKQGIVNSLFPNFNSIPAGTLVAITGAGSHTVVLANTSTGCADTLTVNALEGVDILFIATLENVPSQPECLDISGLPGNVFQISLCAAPQNGMIVSSGNCFSYNPANGFIGTDEACLVVCDNLGNCDTTLVYITVDPLCSLYDFFPDGTQTLTVNDCLDKAAYCVPVPLDSLVNFGVLVNGNQVIGGFTACNGNQTEMKFDTGFYEVVFFHMNTFCADTLLLEVKCQPANTGCGTDALSPLTLALNDCNEKAQFCVDINVTSLPNFLVTKNGLPVTSGIGPCDTGSSFAGIQLDTGSYELIFSDTVKGCSDTFLVEVVCPLFKDVIIDTTVLLNNSIVICLEDYDFPAVLIDSVTNVCASQSSGNVSFALDTMTWCITITGITVGQDTACFKVYAADTCGTVTVHVTVPEPCPVWFPQDTIASGTSNCATGTGLLCLPVSIPELQGKIITVDGVVYAGLPVGCNFDSTFVLNYKEFPGMGIIGPYILNSWSINGSIFTGVFNSAQALADSMSLWDTAANWTVVIEPISMDTMITGGSSANIYGPLNVTQQLTGITAQVGINGLFIPTGAALSLSIGFHQITITDPVTNCSDATVGLVACVTSDIFSDTIMVDSAGTYCLNLSELNGNVASVTNVCPGTNGEVVDFVIQDTCIVYTGLEPGLDSACIVVCDEFGSCDTTYIFITVLGGMPGDTLIAVNDTSVTGEGQPKVIDIFGNDIITSLDQFYIVNQPAHGEATFQPDGSVNYVPEAGFCDDVVPDSFTYAICDPVICDTATVYVLVECTSLKIYNGFSPNEDGYNDYFKITGLQNFPDHKLRVFNRWGNLVLEVTNYQSDWDGTWDGKLLPDGTYYYVLDLGNGKKPMSGFVQLNR